VTGFRQKLFRGFQFLLFLLIGLVLLYFAFRGIRFSAFLEELIHARYAWVVASLSFGLISHLLRAARWNLLIEPLGYRPGLKNTFLAVMTGYLANYAFPRIGEITRCAALNRKSKVPVDQLLGTVVAERAVDFLMLIVLFLLVFFMKIHFFGSFIRKTIFLPTYESVREAYLSRPVLWIVLASLLLSSLAALILFRRQIMRIRGFSKIREVIQGVITGIRSVFRMKKRGVFLLYTFLVWAMYFLMTWVVFFTIPATHSLGPADGLFILVFGTIGMTLPVQGGIGTYHLLVSLGLSLYGIPREDGLVYAIISHESQTLLVLIVGGISMFLVFFGKRNISRINIS